MLFWWAKHSCALPIPERRLPRFSAEWRRAAGASPPELPRRGELRELRQARLGSAWSIPPILVVLEGGLCDELDRWTVPVLFAGSVGIALCAVFPLAFDVEAIEGSGRDCHRLVSNHLVASAALLRWYDCRPEGPTRVGDRRREHQQALDD